MARAVKGAAFKNPRAEHKLVLYPGVLVSFLVPREYESALLEEAIAKIKHDLETSIKRHLPAGCIAELQKMA